MKRLVLILMAASVGGCTPTDPAAEKIEAAKQTVARDLFDPSAVQFRNVVVYPSAICGQFNGKNRLGAYVGFKDFIYVAGRSEVMPRIDFDDPASLEAIQQFLDRKSSVCTN